MPPILTGINALDELAASATSSRQTMPAPSLRGKVPRRAQTVVTLENIDWWAVDPFLLLDVLPDISPDAGLALHNVLRLANPGWSMEVRTPRGKLDKGATLAAWDMLSRASRGVDSEIPGAMGGPDALVNTLLLQAYMKGAMCAETVLTPNLDDVDDIVAVEPTSIVLVHNPDNPGKYYIGQKQKGAPDGWKELNPNLVTYNAVDDDLYGRAPVAPALQIIPFWLRFYQELQVFLHHSAWGFIDGSVTTEGLLKVWSQMDDAQRMRYQDEFFKWAFEQVKRFANSYRSEAHRDPDALIAHLDLLKLESKNRGNTSFPITGVAELCKKEIYAALKMLPVFMGSNEGTTETHGTVQMSIFHSGLKRFQDMVRHVLRRALLVGFQARGFSKKMRLEDIILEFDEIAVEDRLNAARASEIESKVAAYQRDQGWIDQNEASIRVTGSEPVAEPPTQDGKILIPGAPLNPTPRKPAPNTPPDDDSSEDESRSGGRDSFQRITRPRKQERILAECRRR